MIRLDCGSVGEQRANLREVFAEEVTLKWGFEASVGVGTKEGGRSRERVFHV